MQWCDDCSDDWDEAPENPPTVDRAPVKLSRLQDGYVVRPASPPTDDDGQARSLYCSEVRPVEPARDAT
ncbi:hypothetical protein [Halobaculum sp. D14]|uniref:hypothetical protein n=1 Tax=unclassified Halobaculum TaxID=2640896 RepID=UPI003EBBD38A